MTYDEAFTGVNVLGTEIGVGEEFEFPALSSGRYVRLQGDLEVDEWMSVNEVGVSTLSVSLYLVY